MSKVQYADIVEFFFTERIESVNIEFKSYATNEALDTQIKTLQKTVCAMLNSEGGLIIWGAPREQVDPKNKIKTCKGALFPVPSLYTRDQLINKFVNTITPLPSKIKMINVSNGEGHVYIFEIQESSYKPHQCNDTYWIRLDGQTKAAPHYFVEALFRQITYPKIVGYVAFNKVIVHEQKVSIDLLVEIFNLSMHQNEQDVEYQLASNMGAFFAHQGNRPGAFTPYYNCVENSIPVLHYGSAFAERFTLVVEKGSAINNGIAMISLTVGGRISPRKVSSYWINLYCIENLEEALESTSQIELALADDYLTIQYENTEATKFEGEVEKYLNRYEKRKRNASFN